LAERKKNQERNVNQTRKKVISRLHGGRSFLAKWGGKKKSNHRVDTPEKGAYILGKGRVPINVFP